MLSFLWNPKVRCCVLPSGIFSSGFSTEILCAFLISAVVDTRNFRTGWDKIQPTRCDDLGRSYHHPLGSVLQTVLQMCTTLKGLPFCKTSAALPLTVSRIFHYLLILSWPKWDMNATTSGQCLKFHMLIFFIVKVCVYRRPMPVLDRCGCSSRCHDATAHKGGISVSSSNLSRNLWCIYWKHTKKLILFLCVYQAIWLL